MEETGEKKRELVKKSELFEMEERRRRKRQEEEGSQRKGIKIEKVKEDKRKRVKGVERRKRRSTKEEQTASPTRPNEAVFVATLLLNNLVINIIVMMKISPDSCSA